VNRRAGVELETSGQEEARDKGRGKGVTSAAAEAFLFLVARRMVRRRLVPSDAYRVWFTARRDSARAARGIGFKSLMHFGYYLMIAALVLMGLEVLYALYQLSTFL
jgi:hypothetical protein